MNKQTFNSSAKPQQLHSNVNYWTMPSFGDREIKSIRVQEGWDD